MDTAPLAGMLEGRRPHLKIKIFVERFLKTQYLPDDVPDHFCPVGRGEDKDEAAAGDDDTGKLHAGEDYSVLIIISWGEKRF